MQPIILTLIFYVAAGILTAARPNAGRVLVGLFFWTMALGVHGYLILFNPQSYVEFARSAYLGIYRDLAVPVVEFSPRGFGVLCLLFEVAVGTLILSRRRWARAGLLAAIAFLLAITPLGEEELANPVLALVLAYLLTTDCDRSLPDLVRSGLRRRGRTPALPTA